MQKTLTWGQKKTMGFLKISKSALLLLKLETFFKKVIVVFHGIAPVSRINF